MFQEDIKVEEFWPILELVVVFMIVYVVNSKSMSAIHKTVSKTKSPQMPRIGAAAVTLLSGMEAILLVAM
jgi:hypothetical protein